MTDISPLFAFLTEADRLKGVERANVLMDNSRLENSAEHSWHVALYAMVFAEPGLDLDRVLAMILLHDLVEIDCGDHPIHLPHDLEAVACAEDAAAVRLFGLLPDGADYLALWREFEAAETPEARFAKRMDHIQPLFQVLQSPEPRPDHVKIVRDNLATGRVARFATEWPEAAVHFRALLDGQPMPEGDFARRLAFLANADRLKTVLRAGILCDGSRRENTAEHSWHLALYALILGGLAGPGVSVARVIKMLILHDIIEIDTGDVPLHSQGGTAHASDEQVGKERRAADRIYGLLPDAQGAEFRALWDEFEAAETPDAIFGKALDRAQPVALNIACGGGTWVEYDVTYDQLYQRVAVKIERGAPALWAFLREKAVPILAEIAERRG
ncbi:HD domain-containing protein [Paracoccus aminophilus]|uniref:5'-deoxynucleotidase n=1 Tax=Paracoccus aminophilus JCM 7686 TaxID=1367847 RepID=S5YEG8_PARAH|nr:HD domain-containing protein [Paracoccus aminophilus]AGT09883.1 hydrolase, HD family [Paracoccus aminophilus JCM 7686]